jgi:hypothetical protein
MFVLKGTNRQDKNIPKQDVSAKPKKSDGIIETIHAANPPARGKLVIRLTKSHSQTKEKGEKKRIEEII